MQVSSTSQAPRLHLLEEFLEASFTDLELRNLAIEAFEDGLSLSRSLPGAGASARQLAWSIVMLIDHHHGAPPPSLWAHLHQRRRCRRAEIDRIRVQFDGEPAPGAAPELPALLERARPVSPQRSGLVIDARSHGSRDLLELLGPYVEAGSLAGGSNTAAALLSEQFSQLVPGRVNGLRRSFVIAWTERVVSLHVTPSLYCEGQQMPEIITLKVPVEDAVFAFYPCGRHDYRIETGGPRVYGVRIEAWSARRRRIVLTSPRSGEFTIELRSSRESVP